MTFTPFPLIRNYLIQTHSNMSWVYDLIPPPETRGPITWQSFTSDILPSIILYFLTAYLVLTPGTLHVRLSLLPVSLWSFFRTATRIDVVHGLEHREVLIYLNQGLMLVLTVSAGRCIGWSYQQKPYYRVHTIPGKREAKPNDGVVPLTTRLLDTFDLVINLRGHGWNWSKGLQVPDETRPTHSRGSFFLSTLISFIKYLLIADHLHWCIQWFDPANLGSANGGSIYDFSRPLYQNLLRSTTITSLASLLIYFSIQAAYDLMTLLGVAIFRQHPLQWPPLFDKPWLSTSLNEFWAKRWHQIFRDIFISVGGKPLSLLIGKIGGILGAFLISAILHDFGLWGMGRGSEFSAVGGYFLIEGLGIILEHAWKRFTGSKVGGPIGRIWTVVWALGWGNLLVDACCRKGLCASQFHPDRFRPSFFTLGKLPFNLGS